jgi:hypothetical protein
MRFLLSFFFGDRASWRNFGAAHAPPGVFWLKSGLRWGGSSAGRAPRSQCGGREFDPHPLHHPYKGTRISSESLFSCSQTALIPVFHCSAFIGGVQLQLHKIGQKFSFGNKNTDRTTETKYCI